MSGLVSKAVRLMRSSPTRPIRHFASLSTRVTSSSSTQDVSSSLIDSNEIQHLLENENEYGIANPMRMDKFSMENYDKKICEVTGMVQLLPKENKTFKQAKKVVHPTDLFVKKNYLKMQRETTTKHGGYDAKPQPEGATYKKVKVKI